MQTSIRSTTDSTQHGDLPRTENDGGNSWKWLRSSLGLARDHDDVIFHSIDFLIHSLQHVIISYFIRPTDPLHSSLNPQYTTTYGYYCTSASALRPKCLALAFENVVMWIRIQIFKEICCWLVINWH